MKKVTAYLTTDGKFFLEDEKATAIEHQKIVEFIEKGKKIQEELKELILDNYKIKDSIELDNLIFFIIDKKNEIIKILK